MLTTCTCPENSYANLNHQQNVTLKLQIDDEYLTDRMDCTIENPKDGV